MHFIFRILTLIWSCFLQWLQMIWKTWRLTWDYRKKHMSIMSFWTCCLLLISIRTTWNRITWFRRLRIFLNHGFRNIFGWNTLRFGVLHQRSLFINLSFFEEANLKFCIPREFFPSTFHTKWFPWRRRQFCRNNDFGSGLTKACKGEFLRWFCLWTRTEFWQQIQNLQFSICFRFWEC